MFKYYPTKFECVDDADNTIFKLDTFDEETVSIEMSTCIGTNTWPEISAAIQDCLNQMLEVDVSDVHKTNSEVLLKMVDEILEIEND